MRPTDQNQQFADAVDQISPTSENDFVLVESPSKSRKKQSISDGSGSGSGSVGENGIPPVPAIPPSMSFRGGLASAGNTAPAQRRLKDDSFRPLDRVKTLPPPPVGQVIPDFDDLIQRKPSPNNLGTGEETQGNGLRRKTSVVKKIKDRMK